MSPFLRPVPLSASVLLAGLCACVTSSPRLPPGAVVLRFAWPRTLSARVAHSVVSGGGSGERVYWWSLGPGTREGQRRLEVRPGESPDPGIAVFATPEMSVLFDDEGTFTGYEPPDGSVVQDLLEALPPDSDERAGLRQRLDASQEEAARVRWEQRVGHWRDVMLLPGETVRFATTMWMGRNAFQRDEVQAEERTTVEVGVACVPGEAERRCVRLRVETEPLEPYKAAQPCERARARKTFELVTDPETLLPYLTRAIREDEQDWCEADGTVATERTREGEAFVFTYGQEPLPPGSWTRR